jgi:RNA polymerase sigma factor (sigma-70 family)
MEPWLSELNAGHHQAAWDLFAERYRRLILATIRRLIRDHDDLMDVYSDVCQALNEDDLARLKRFVDRPAHGAQFSTWLVAVVRNLCIDWLRSRDGRRRPVIPAALSSLQQEIYAAVFIGGRSHIEAYELIAARSPSAMQFSGFLREVRETYRLAPSQSGEPLRRALPEPLPDDLAASASNPAEAAEAARRIAGMLASLSADVRLAVELFVVERMAAADVARTVGWPNAKAVYNKVYRALEGLRSHLERDGIGRHDL